MTEAACPCGEVHELSAAVRAAYEKVTARLPSLVPVETAAGTWLVPRIYIAVHGLRADELPALAERYGFAPRLAALDAQGHLQNAGVWRGDDDRARKDVVIEQRP